MAQKTLHGLLTFIPMKSAHKTPTRITHIQLHLIRLQQQIHSILTQFSLK